MSDLTHCVGVPAGLWAALVAAADRDSIEPQALLDAAIHREIVRRQSRPPLPRVPCTEGTYVFRSDLLTLRQAARALEISVNEFRKRVADKTDPLRKCRSVRFPGYFDASRLVAMQRDLRKQLAGS